MNEQGRGIPAGAADISFYRQTVEYLTGALPGGVILYRKDGEQFTALAHSAGLPSLGDYDHDQLEQILSSGGLNLVCRQDRPNVADRLTRALTQGEQIQMGCRLRAKGGNLIWVRLSAGPINLGAETLALAVFTSVADETLIQRAGGAMDAVYVIDLDSYALLYVGGDQTMWGEDRVVQLGEPCYATLHGRQAICENCPLSGAMVDGVREITLPDRPGRVYRTKSQHIDWNGKPAYIQYVQDVTEESNLRQDRDRLDKYYRTLVRNMPGGMGVVRREPDGQMVAEFLSQGFADMLGMTQEEAMACCAGDALQHVHPDDRERVRAEVENALAAGLDGWKKSCRMQRKNGECIWVQNNCSLIAEQGRLTIYVVYTDITEEIRAQTEKKQRYADMLRHYRESDQADAILILMSNISHDRILEIRDRSENRIASRLGHTRDAFLTQLSRLLPDREGQAFLRVFSNEALKDGFRRGVYNGEMKFFVQLPGEDRARYLRVTEEVMTEPDSGDLIGIMLVRDVTLDSLLLQTQQHLISDNYDFIMAMDLLGDRYLRLMPEGGAGLQIQNQGVLHTGVRAYIEREVLPRDREKCMALLEPAYIRRRLREEGSYSFHYFTRAGEGSLTKRALVFSMDETLDWVCFARADITASVQEQQALLNMLAQTFEIVAVFSLDNRSCSLYTRETIMDNQPPLTLKSPRAVAEHFLDDCGQLEAAQRQTVLENLTIPAMLQRLKEEPEGYSLTVETAHQGQSHYKQIDISWSGNEQRGLCVLRRDVTQSTLEGQRQTEHLRGALSMARDANRAKTDFLSTMSHDIRTPMNAIIGMTDLALAHRDDPPQMEESLRIIRDSAYHLRDLIGDILDMSRIEGGRLVLNKAPFSQSERMGMVADRTRVLANQRDIAFHYTIDVRHDACVGDPLRLEQILENLLGNAVKFTNPGGEIVLEVEELPRRGKHVVWYRYIVRDSGIGMKPETLARLYDPFYRESSGQVQETEGTGLGLSIVRNLVDYKGGVMEVHSQEGRGTEFVVELPLLPADPADVARMTEARRRNDKAVSNVCLLGRRILLVEDHPVNRIVAQRLVEDVGAVVETAADGAEGVAAFCGSAPGTYDAILMDIRMPVMDGYQATAAIRASKHPQAADIPIIAMTANAFAQDVQRCINAGMDAHVAKPVDRQELLNNILRLLRH